MSSADMTPESLPLDVDGSHGTSDIPQDDAAPDDTARVEPDHDPGSSGPATPPPRRRRWWAWGLGVALATGAVLGGLFVPTPYLLLQPGALRPAEARIEVDGAPVYADDGDVLFTTVYVNDATLFGLLRGSLDDAIEVRTQEEVYGTSGRDATREVNRELMDLSKLVATFEALQVLGYHPVFTADGARVVEVVPGSGADGTIEPGDVIVAVDDQPVALPAELRGALEGRAPGDEVTVTLRRPTASSGKVVSGEAASGDGDSSELQVEVALGPSGDTPERPVLGVNVEPTNPRVDAPIDVQIDAGTVTGPSAGLAWSLAIIDALTPGSLVDGRDVAVTGEILEDGSVGVIGGLPQKVSTVVRNGVELFLYPADTPEDEQREMRRIAGDDLELVPVSTLAEAVEYLAPDGLELPTDGS